MCLKILLLLIAFPGILYSQWFQQYSGTNSFLSKVRMLNVYTGYAIGDSSHFLKTTNGGLNWVNINTGTSPDNYFMGIHFVNIQTGYVCGGFMNGVGASKILKTTNGGLNWTIQHQNSFEFYSAINFVNADTGFTGGYDGKFYKTTNGGLNWVSMYVTGVSIWTITFINQFTGFVAGELGMIRKTTDCGLSWSLLPSGTNQRIASLFFTDNNNGYGVCDSEVVIKTTNGGMNWTSQRLGSAIGYESVHFVNQLTGFAVGNWWEVATYKLIKTSNAGINWHSISQGEGDPYFDIYFANESTGWITGYNGLILKTTNGGTTFVKNESGIIHDYRLKQNSPNPFNPVTRIGFEVPKQSFVNISIYDVSGKIIETLTNQQYSAGKYETIWDAGKYPSSAYFCRINSESYSQTIKMILLK